MILGTVEVRLLSIDDLPLLDHVDEGVFDHAVQRALAEQFLAAPDTLLAVATLSGAVVGMASAIAYLHPDKPLQLFINEVGVSERVRSQGIGKRLVRTLIEQGRSMGCTEAWVATEAGNVPARALYSSLNGVEDPDNAIVYTWKLRDRAAGASETTRTDTAPESVVPADRSQRSPVVLSPGEGRSYGMGRIRAVFKADGTETRGSYSISEWWLEPHTGGPGAHCHAEDDVFYILEGIMSVLVGSHWRDAPKGSFVLVPAGTTHDFENRSSAPAGLLNFSCPGSFEQHMPAIVEWFRLNPPDRA
jgi:ribosomal protein S18 acetylase RimI-like enzyme/mannose-6-phosphate isomerase-like protein (cupin superfamily)